MIYKMYKSKALNKNQKIINTILIILIPFIWGIIVSYVIKPSEKGCIDREEEIKKERNIKYYESNKGIWPL